MKGLQAKRMRNWIGISAGEAVMRLLLQVGVTAVLARLLAPDAFGMAALLLTIVAFLAIGVGTPFEEGLAQQKRLRRAQIEGVYGFVILSAILAFLLACLGGAGLAWWFEREAFLYLMPFTALLLFAHGPFALGLALARRRRSFVAINAAHLVGNIIGAIVAIISGFLGAGVWALLAFRVATVVASAITLFVLLGYRLRPRLRPAQLRGFDSFAWIMLKARSVENSAYLLFNILVAQLFGIAALGIVNMALRIVEPVRGAVAAIGHNLSFPLFKAARENPERLREAIRTASGQSAILSAPVFMGLAAISPVLIPLLAGPGWEPAIPIAALLALGGMLLMPSQILIAAFTAQGRPAFGLYAPLIGVTVLCAGLLLSADGDVVAVGVARFAADLAQVLAVFTFGAIAIGLAPQRLFSVLAAPWIAALAMAAAVAGIAYASPDHWPPLATLLLLVGSGGLIYGSLLFLIARERLESLLRTMKPQRTGNVSQEAAS
jgi:O-antigen/teichoic acid export membrane protein